MTKQNESATELWTQVFTTMAKAETATLMDPEYNEAEDEARFRKAMAEAGWSESEIQQKLEIQKQMVAAGVPVTSPGANPRVERQFGTLSDAVEEAMDRLGIASHARVARGIEPRAGPIAAKTNVVLTDQSIVTVGSFLFRFCGLVARAFTRTIYLEPAFWDSSKYSAERAIRYLLENPEVARYWFGIFNSFAVTGTHIMTRLWPANRYELICFEQVAHAMEIFAIAHEYGHHDLNHGRHVEVDSKAEEFEADEFALRISCEVDRRPVLFPGVPNPYLASGAGGIILLLALKVLHEFENDFLGSRVNQARHPEILLRIARFGNAAVEDPMTFAELECFRTAANQVMTSVGACMTNFRSAVPSELRAQIQELHRRANPS